MCLMPRIFNLEITYAISFPHDGLCFAQQQFLFLCAHWKTAFTKAVQLTCCKNGIVPWTAWSAFLACWTHFWPWIFAFLSSICTEVPNQRPMNSYNKRTRNIQINLKNSTRCCNLCFTRKPLCHRCKNHCLPFPSENCALTQRCAQSQVPVSWRNFSVWRSQSMMV